MGGKGKPETGKDEGIQQDCQTKPSGRRSKMADIRDGLIVYYEDETSLCSLPIETLLRYQLVVVVTLAANTFL